MGECIGDKIQDKWYELKAVSSHIGESGDMGHYVAYCKDDYNIWHLFNDSIHNECQFSDVKSNSPYILIYKRMVKP